MRPPRRPLSFEPIKNETAPAGGELRPPNRTPEGLVSSRVFLALDTAKRRSPSYPPLNGSVPLQIAGVRIGTSNVGGLFSSDVATYAFGGFMLLALAIGFFAAPG